MHMKKIYALLFIFLISVLSCSQKEDVDQLIRNILQDKKPYSRGGDLFSLAQKYEQGEEWAKAIKVYKVIIDNFYSKYPDELSGRTYGFLAEQRIQWIKSDKSWYFDDKDALIQKIKESLESGDADTLVRYACKGWFTVSCASTDDVYKEDRREILRFFRENLRNSIVRVEKVAINEFSRDEEHKENHLWIKTVGWKIKKEFRRFKHKEIKLKINKDSRGWQWDGMMFDWGRANRIEFLDWLDEKLSDEGLVSEEEKIYPYIEDYFVFNRAKSKNILVNMLKSEKELHNPGRAYFLLAEIEASGTEAEEMYEKVISDCPGSPVRFKAENKLKFLRENSNEPQEALKWYIKGKQARERRKYRESIKYFKNLMEKYPKWKWAGFSQFSLASAYFSRKEFEDARIEFKRVFEEYKNSKDEHGNRLAPFAMLFFATSYYSQRKYSEAISAYEKLINLSLYYSIKIKDSLIFSPAMQARYYMAWSHNINREYEKAFKVFHTLLKIKKDYAIVAKLYCGNSPFSCACDWGESIKAEATIRLADLYIRKKKNADEAFRLYAQILTDSELKVKRSYDDDEKEETYFAKAISWLINIQDVKYKEKISDILKLISLQSLTKREEIIMLKNWVFFHSKHREYLKGLEKWAEYVQLGEGVIPEKELMLDEEVRFMVLLMDKTAAKQMFKTLESIKKNITSMAKKGFIAYLEADYLENKMKDKDRALDKYRETIDFLKNSKHFWVYRKTAEGKVRTLSR